jgi:hypothetical protein
VRVGNLFAEDLRPARGFIRHNRSFIEAIDVDPHRQAEDLSAIRCSARSSVVE